MRTWIGVALAASLLGITPLVVAQEPSEGRFRHAIGCTGQVASRLSSSNLDCGDVQSQRDPIVITTEVPAQPIVVEMPAVVITDCEAIIQFEYTQRGALARVEGTIENETCPASSGSFTVSLRTSDDNFEQTTLEFQETWQRDDDEDLNFSRDYEIGDNVDLIRVRTSKSMCKCAVAE